MGMKYVKKSKLKFENGYFLHKGKVVSIDPAVVSQFNQLEDVFQQAQYLSSQPEAVPAPSLDGYARKSAVKKAEVKVLCDTPLLDEQYKKAIEIMEEIDHVTNANSINQFIERYDDLIQWINSDKVWINTKVGCKPRVVDTPCIGNPLEVKIDSILATITFIETGEFLND